MKRIFLAIKIILLFIIDKNKAGFFKLYFFKFQVDLNLSNNKTYVCFREIFL